MTPAPSPADAVRKPSPPGDTIADIMQEKGRSRRSMCCKLHISGKALTNLLRGNFRIDNDMACKLSEILGSTPEFWENREKQYREALEEMEAEIPHDTRRSSGQQKVYLVAIADVDTFSLKHACLSEETAHRRFHEIRREIMTENLGMIEHDKEEGIDPTMWIEMNRRLESLTPDGDIKECGERPVIEVMELEP